MSYIYIYIYDISSLMVKYTQIPVVFLLMNLTYLLTTKGAG